MTESTAVVERESTELTQAQQDALMEKVVIGGDLKELAPRERMAYYNMICQQAGLNPVMQPLRYLWLSEYVDGQKVAKLTLYWTKGAAEELRRVHHISLSEPKVQISGGIILATVNASLPNNRTDSDVGAVSASNRNGPLKSDFLANAIMKAVTKGKRRVTFSIIGLGHFMSEEEMADTQDAIAVTPEEAHGVNLTPPAQPLIEKQNETVSEAVSEPTDAEYTAATPAEPPESPEQIELHQKSRIAREIKVAINSLVGDDIDQQRAWGRKMRENTDIPLDFPTENLSVDQLGNMQAWIESQVQAQIEAQAKGEV